MTSMLVIPKVYDRKTMVFLQEYHNKLSVTIKNPANLLQDYHKNITKGPRDYYRKARYYCRNMTVGISQIYYIQFNKDAVVKRPKKTKQ